MPEPLPAPPSVPPSCPRAFSQAGFSSKSPFHPWVPVESCSSSGLNSKHSSGSLMSRSRQLWACLGLWGARAAPGPGRQPCDYKLNETELVPTLCSIHLLEQRQLSSPQGGPPRVCRWESSGDVWPAIVLPS